MFVIGSLAIFLGQASADTLLIDTVEKNANVSRPDRGMSRAQVESEYGKAVKKYSAVGTPPITKWSYQSMTVYFEHDHVIHSVVNRKKKLKN